MNVRDITDALFPIIEKYKNNEHIELELRLGKFNGSMFDTNVGKQIFEKLQIGFTKYPGWDKVICEEHEVFYRDSDGLRISTDQATGDETIIRKERVLNKDFKMGSNIPFDLRFSVSKEIPVSDDVNRDMDKKKIKQRLSFIRKNVTIDITIVTGDTHDLDSEDPMSYQVEFEIINPSNITSKDDLFKILHKINDVFIMLNNNR
jgi:hypothetical protein